MLSARMQGADEVFAIDSVDHRLEMAEKHAHAVPLDRDELGRAGVQRELKLRTGGRGPDAVIEAVGLEAGDGALGAYHKAKQALRLEQDRPIALTEAILACRKGGSVSVPGVFSGLIDKFPMGAVFGKGLRMQGGQAPIQRYVSELLDMIERKELDPTFVITHRVPLEEAAEAYRMFRDDKEHVVKVVLEP